MPPDEYDYVVAAIDDAPLEYYVVQNIALGLVAEIRRIKKEHRPLVDLLDEISDLASFPYGWDESRQEAFCFFCTWEGGAAPHAADCWRERAVKALEAYRGR